MDCPTQPEDSWYERYSRQVREGHAQRKRDLEAVRAGEANARIDQGVPLAISEGQHDPRYVLGCSMWLFQRAGTSTGAWSLTLWRRSLTLLIIFQRGGRGGALLF